MCRAGEFRLGNADHRDGLLQGIVEVMAQTLSVLVIQPNVSIDDNDVGALWQLTQYREQTRQFSSVELAGDIRFDLIDVERVLTTRIRVFPIFECDAGGSRGRIVVSHVDASQHLIFFRRNCRDAVSAT